MSNLLPAMVAPEEIQKSAPFNPPQTVADYVRLYLSCRRKSVESLLLLAITLADAQDKLDERGLLAFCREIGIKVGSPTYCKHIVIAGAAERFKEVLDKLPACWTTLYDLAKLGDNEFMAIKPDLHPHITAKAINTKVGKRPKNGNRKNVFRSDGGKCPDIQIHLKGLSVPDRFAVVNQLRSMKSRYGFQLIESDDLTEWLFKNDALEAA